MAKRTRVALHGVSNNRGILIDADATDGATVGRNLRWSNGDLVLESEIRGGSTTTTTTTGSAVQPTLWSLIISKPEIIKQLAALDYPGYLYFDGTDLTGTEFPLHDIRVETTEVLTIPANKQYLIWQEIIVQGDLVVEPGGELVILDEEPYPDPVGPAFSYSGGNLSQVDYDAGEQKSFTYNGSGQLTQLDFVRDGLTYRKEFFYTGGGDLDYIDEYYV